MQSFQDFDVYIPSTANRNLLIGDNYKLSGGYFFLERGTTSDFFDGSFTPHPPNDRRTVYLDDGKTLTLGGDFVNGGSKKEGIGGQFYAGTNSTLNIAGSLFTSYGVGLITSSLFVALPGSTVVLNGAENQELRLSTNVLYNLTIDKASGTVVVQGTERGVRFTHIIKNKFLVLKGGFSTRSMTALVIQGDYEQQGGAVDFDLSPITVQGNFKVTGGTLTPTSSTMYFTPNTTANRVIQLDNNNVSLNKVVFNRKTHIPTVAHSGNDPSDHLTTQRGKPITTSTSGIVKYTVSSGTNTFEVLNDVTIEDNRQVTFSKDLVATVGNIAIKDGGVMSTLAGTELQIRKDKTLLVDDGGMLNVIGSVLKYAKISRKGTGTDAYSFKVNGTLKARYYLIEFTDVDGVNLGSTAKTLSPGVTIVGGGGENYTASTTVTVVGGGGIGATATTKITASLTKINVSTQGGGYTAVPTVTIDAPTGTGPVQATATAVIKGPVTGMYMTNGGEYSTLPSTITFTPATAPGSGASGIVKAGIKNISLTNAGDKYASAPAVIISGGGGGSGTAISTTLSAKVVSYRVVNGGEGYVSVPATSDITIDNIGTNNTSSATVAGVSCVVTGAKDIVGGSGYNNTTTVTIDGGTFTTQATATPVISGGQLTGITITSSGSEYTVAPTGITISGPGSGASCRPVLSIESLTLGVGGGGYESPPSISIVLPPAALDIPTKPATVTANMSGVVKSISVDNSGQGYTSTPTISIQSPGASASAVISSGQVQSVTILEGGTYYTSIPLVTFSAGTTTATGHAIVSNGVVTEIVVDNRGSGYATAPTVTLSLPAGGVQATASFTMTINEIALSRGGLNYELPPIVALSGGTVVGGDKATVQATMSVQSLDITNAGAGYAKPNIVIQAPELAVGIGVANGAIQAAAVTETVGEITSVTVSNGGSDYTGTPYIIITDPNGRGRGAAAKPILNNTTVSHITVIDGGHYTAVPTVTLSGGLGSGSADATATAVMVAPGFNEISKARIDAKGSGCTTPDNTYDVNVPGGDGKAVVLVTVVGGVVADAKVKVHGLGYSDVDISSAVATACGCSTAPTVVALAGSRIISPMTVNTKGANYIGTPVVTITPQAGDTEGGDGAAIAYLTKTSLKSIELTTKNVYPVATFSDGIFTNGYSRSGGAINGVFITFPENYSVYRNNVNDYSTIESLSASVTHNYNATPVVDTIYNVLFPQNPTRTSDPFNSNNVRRNGTGTNAVNHIVFKDALGTFSGEDYDDEQGANNIVIWVEPNIVRWDGGTSSSGTSWSNPNNWRPNGVPTPDKHVIIDYQLMALQFNSGTGPGTVIAPTTFLVEMDLKPTANPITCRSLTIETLIPGLNPTNSREPILLNLNRPLTILESFSASSGTTIDVKNSTATISVGGSWSNEGKFIHGLGTVEFNQPLTRTINATSVEESYTHPTSEITKATVGTSDVDANAFYNLILSDGNTELNSYIRVENDLTIKNSGTKINPSNNNYTIELWGKWQNEGNFDPKAGKVIFAANLPQTVGKGFRTLAEATASLSGTTVGSISLTSGKEGEKYAVAPQIVIEGGGGYGATGTATVASDGTIASLTLTNGGSGYTTAPTVSFVPIDKESFFNVDVYKVGDHVTLLTRTEISSSLVFKAHNIVSDTLRECIVGGNVVSTNGYVDGPMGRIYNATVASNQFYAIGKETKYPGVVSFELKLNASPSTHGDEGKALYIIERFNGLPVTGRVTSAIPEVNVLVNAHYRAYQAPYPFISSNYPKNSSNTDLDFSEGKIGIPLSLTVENITTSALAGVTTPLSGVNVADLDNYRILQDPGDGTSSAAKTKKGLDSEVPYHTNGASWKNLGGENTISATIGGATVIGSVSSFTQLGSGTFALGLKYLPLPVDFLRLEATPQGKKVLLKWTSFVEKDLDHYDIEKSVDGVSFVKMGDQKALGNKGLAQNYNTADVSPANGLNYYRLKVYDMDGTSRYSQIVSAKVTFDAGFSIYPNPNDGSYVKISSEVALPEGDIQVTITDISGKLVHTEVIKAGSRTDTNSFELKSLRLSSGLHFINLKGKTLTTRLKLMINR